MKKILAFFELSFFGVCSKLANILGISTISVRLFFIYFSFLTFGSPIIIYLSLAFLLDIRKHFRRHRRTFFEY